ncbi:G-type lectin S-receptor-like serine/threonine-protein kinase SD2-5 [Tanacetum coccineum]
MIGSIRHHHLVKLKGFCAEVKHRLLVYEYMANGSLDRWIFGEFLLDWDTRYNIAIGTAKGLAYLQEDCDVKIVHCDIKPENVLLDDNFLAKISDFGLAKLMTREQSHVFTTLRGTRGYLVPEWITNHAISEKSDVYSYGMVLLEIISGQKNYAFKIVDEGLCTVPPAPVSGQTGPYSSLYRSFSQYRTFPGPSDGNTDASLSDMRLSGPRYDLVLLQKEIRKVFSKGKAAGVLRLVFHDAGTYDMDDDSVSMADTIAVAGAEAVSLCGGPTIPIRLGRLDSMVPDPEGKLPEETLNAFGLKQSFQRKGFSTQELVALSGAHTLGSKGFGNPVVFDNAYYKVLLEKPWQSSGFRYFSYCVRTAGAFETIFDEETIIAIFLRTTLFL